MLRRNLSAWLCVAPLMLVLVPFFLLPILVVLAASFFETVDNQYDDNWDYLLLPALRSSQLMLYQSIHID